MPWQWDPDADEVSDKLLVRLLSDDEKKHLSGPSVAGGTKTVYRMRLKRDDFIERGFTEGCMGCKAILDGSGVRGHSEACRKRMEDLLKQTTEGQDRHQKQRDRENQYFSRVLEEADKSESENKRRRLKEIEEEALRTEDPKRTAELFDEYMNEYKTRRGAAKMLLRALEGG